MKQLTQDECYRYSRQLRAINEALPAPVLLEVASYFEGHAFDLGKEPCCAAHPTEVAHTTDDVRRIRDGIMGEGMRAPPEEVKIGTVSGLMRCDPATGESWPYPSEAKQYRAYHGKRAWLFNPWTGKPRSAEDVGSDPFGHLIKFVPPLKRGVEQ